MEEVGGFTDGSNLYMTLGLYYGLPLALDLNIAAFLHGRDNSRSLAWMTLVYTVLACFGLEPRFLVLVGTLVPCCLHVLLAFVCNYRVEVENAVDILRLATPETEHRIHAVLMTGMSVSPPRR